MPKKKSKKPIEIEVIGGSSGSTDLDDSWKYKAEAEPKSNGLKGLIAIGWALWIVAVFIIIAFVSAITLLALRHYGILEDKLTTVQTFVIEAFMYAAMFIVAIILPLNIRRNSTRNKVETSTLTFICEMVGLKRWPKWVDLKYYLANLPVYYITVLVGSIIVAAAVGGEVMSQEQAIGYAATGNTSELIIIFVALVSVAPLFEELLMRGFLYGKLRSLISMWPAAIIVSLMFAAAHGQLNVGIMTFILSMFSCRMREKTGAVWAPIMLHMTVNFVAFSLRFLG